MKKQCIVEFAINDDGDWAVADPDDEAAIDRLRENYSLGNVVRVVRLRILIDTPDISTTTVEVAALKESEITVTQV